RPRCERRPRELERGRGLPLRREDDGGPRLRGGQGAEPGRARPHRLRAGGHSTRRAARDLRGPGVPGLALRPELPLRPRVAGSLPQGAPMNVLRRRSTTTLELTDEEVKLLRWALERASFIDTPVEEQPRIAAFAARALEQLPEPR